MNEKSTIETVDFYPKTFQEIPEQDNPAFGNKECLLLVKDSSTSALCTVLHIVPNPIESVTSIANFWRHNRALEYCEFFIMQTKGTK